MINTEDETLKLLGVMVLRMRAAEITIENLAREIAEKDQRLAALEAKQEHGAE